MLVSSDNHFPPLGGIFCAFLSEKNLHLQKNANSIESSTMLSTIHRRHILSYLEHEKTISLRALKGAFVESGEMNQTTLYRILDKFLDE